MLLCLLSNIRWNWNRGAQGAVLWLSPTDAANNREWNKRITFKKLSDDSQPSNKISGQDEKEKRHDDGDAAVSRLYTFAPSILLSHPFTRFTPHLWISNRCLVAIARSETARECIHYVMRERWERDWVVRRIYFCYQRAEEERMTAGYNSVAVAVAVAVAFQRTTNAVQRWSNRNGSIILS